MRQVNPDIYDNEYYLNVCLGSEEYKKYGGTRLNKRWQKILNTISIKKKMKVLDLGCGRGEVAFYLARKGANVIGIDYSSFAIKIANGSLNKMRPKIKNSVKFYKMDAKQIDFQKNTFDLIVSLDVFEHLYDEELQVIMGKLSKILKKNGTLLVHTEQNKIYLDYTHRLYTYPVSQLLLKANKLIFNKNYSGLPKNLRNEYHMLQHVNEPTIFYLNKLFSNYSFKGKILSNIGIRKPVLGWKDIVYNLIVCLYPFSSAWPLNILFATDYTCIMKNNKL